MPWLGRLMTIRIVPATLRDLNSISANLRPEDQAEIDCQFDAWFAGADAARRYPRRDRTAAMSRIDAVGYSTIFQ